MNSLSGAALWLRGDQARDGVGWHRLEAILESPGLIQQAKRAVRQGRLALCFVQVAKRPVSDPAVSAPGREPGRAGALKDLHEPRDSA